MATGIKAMTIFCSNFLNTFSLKKCVYQSNVQVNLKASRQLKKTRRISSESNGLALHLSSPMKKISGSINAVRCSALMLED
jgi:hypothetical protein